MDLKENSKRKWFNKDEAYLKTTEAIQIGCLLRIADASEMMASNFIALQNDRDLYKRWYKEEQDKRNKLERKIAALKGVITKQNKKLKSV